MSSEERYLVLMLEVLPLPLLPDGSLPASIEGEELVSLEFAYTSITEEGTDLRLESRTSAHLVRIQGTQNEGFFLLRIQLRKRIFQTTLKDIQKDKEWLSQPKTKTM